MRTFVKKISALVKVTAFALPLTTLADTTPTPYVPLAPITTTAGQAVTACSYIPQLFQIGIGIAAGLAVLSIAYHGLQYMLSDVVTSKSAAVDGVKNALLGLLLALAAYLILKTINPALISLNFGCPS